ncbi:hypothetical protein CRUP_026755 [Coryphaenoides rupestris]|nr:hypothetical protein CRUP_026755 [Coryphaenoides rupestris]
MVTLSPAADIENFSPPTNHCTQWTVRLQKSLPSQVRLQKSLPSQVCLKKRRPSCLPLLARGQLTGDGLRLFRSAEGHLVAITPPLSIVSPPVEEGDGSQVECFHVTHHSTGLTLVTHERLELEFGRRRTDWDDWKEHTEERWCIK